MRIRYKPSFLRAFNDLENELQEEVRVKIAMFRENPRHPSLRTHKLKGKLAGRFSFSVNYAYRIIFHYESKDVVALLTVGDHDVYR